MFYLNWYKYTFFITTFDYLTLLDNFKEGLHNLMSTNIYNKYAIDKYWKKLQKEHNWYVVEPALCIQKESYSDIHNVVVNYESYFN